jgi:hypothetical protein
VSTVRIRRPIRGRAAVRGVVSEDRFERWVISVARVSGWRGYHTRKSFGSVMGVSRLDAYGWPDWAFWHMGKRRFLLRELKTQRGIVSAYQRTVIAELAACGVDAKVWRPSDEQEILETFAA